MKRTVTTINNETVLLCEARKFNGAFYKIGDVSIENSGDCYKVGDKFYRFETGQIAYNHRIKKYVLRNESIVTGVIGINGSTLVLGCFNPEENDVEVVSDTSIWPCYDENILKGSRYYREEISTGRYRDIGTTPARYFSMISRVDQKYKQSLEYDSHRVMDQYLAKYNSMDLSISNSVKKYAQILKGLSFGLEFETTEGTLTDRILRRTGLIPLRDGSIQGLEYVTVPLSGEKGLQTVVNATAELAKRTRYNNSCAMHLHIGNVPRTKEFILAFLKTTIAIQDEIYEMFPLYKKYNFGVKNKNYSKPYPAFELLSKMDANITSENINENFDVLYRHLTLNSQRFSDVNNDLNNVHIHPADPDARAKWNIPTRYYIHNLIPLIFGNKKTIEFRIHTPTTNVDKIMHFLFINSIIVNYVIKNSSGILTKEHVLPTRGTSIIQGMIEQAFKGDPERSGLRNSLLLYVSNRKVISERSKAQGDIIGDESKIKVAQEIDWHNSDEPKETAKTYFYKNSKYKKEWVKFAPDQEEQQEEGLLRMLEEVRPIRIK
jgi:hypothetical protein